MRFVPGAPAPLLSNTVGSIGGKATGVGILSPAPIRALTSQWEPTKWSTGRIQAAACYQQGHWVKVGVFYGIATDPKTVCTRQQSDDLLSQLVERVACQAKGMRIICGDFNQEYGALDQEKVLADLGFVEIQRYAKYRWGREITNTCKRQCPRLHVDQQRTCAVSR